MKIGVISDTHIPDKASEVPQEVLEGFKGVDMIIHAGDLVDSSAMQQLNKICKNIKIVRGNMDHYDLTAKLPEKEIVEVDNIRIGVMHGYGAPAGLIELMGNNFKNDHVDIIIFGHSHTPINESHGGILYFNPGSPTDKVFAPYNSYGIIDIDKGKIDAKIIRM